MEVGRTEGWPGSAPGTDPTAAQNAGRRPGLPAPAADSGAGPAAEHTALPRAQQAPPPGSGGSAASQSSPRGSPDRTAARHRPAGKSRSKGRKETGGRGSAETAPSPCRRLLSAAQGEAAARRASRYLSGRAPLAAQPGTRSARHGSKPAPRGARRACARGAGGGRAAPGAEGPGRPAEMGCARPGSGLSGTGGGLAQPNAGGDTVTELGWKVVLKS